VVWELQCDVVAVITWILYMEDKRVDMLTFFSLRIRMPLAHSTDIRRRKFFFREDATMETRKVE
jgi:hypothetical protein